MRRPTAIATKTKKGWYKKYRGGSRYIAPPNTPIEQVNDLWPGVKKRWDAILDAQAAGEAAAADPRAMSFRDVLSDFLAAMERRVQTGKPKPLAPRTFHNYEVDLNDFGSVVGGGTPFADVGPPHFARYAAHIADGAPATYDSKVARVATLFNWAVENEYIDRVRFGSEFSRPGKRRIRDRRIERAKSFTPAEVAKLYLAAGPTLRVMILLGVVAALNNSEVANLGRECVDPETGTLDFRRRKTGRLRRVIPLPEPVAEELRAYDRPEPAERAHAELFFLTEDGNPYVRMLPGGQANTITVLFRRAAEAAGVKTLENGKADGRGFAGLRTTFSNLAPPGYRDEVEVLMGHAHGTILNDHYLETLQTTRLQFVTSHIWQQIADAISTERRGGAGGPADAGASSPGATAAPPGGTPLPA